MQYLNLSEDPNDIKPSFQKKALTREPNATCGHATFKQNPNLNPPHTNQIPRPRKKQLVIKATCKERLRHARKRIKYLTGNQSVKSKNGTKTKIMVGPDFGLAWRNEGGSGLKHGNNKKINPRKVHQYLSQMATPVKNVTHNPPDSEQTKTQDLMSS